jgi:glutamine synthetase
MKVYQAINSVQAELCKIGIAKDSRNNQGAGYNFRGIDAVYNVLSSIMAQNGLVIVPRMLARTCEERISKSGGALFYVTVEAEFDLISAEDGSKHTARTFGEAMDSGDKATNKAMSAAYKYMAFQTFAIPTSGDNDADSSTHEVVRKKPTIDNNRLGQAIQKIKEGAYTTDKLRETFALTAEQEKVLVGALSE